MRVDAFALQECLLGSVRAGDARGLGHLESPESATERHDRARRDEERRAIAAAMLQPTGSAAVINESERRAEFSSRTFGRTLAREQATQQFQDGRQAFRQALTAAREQRDTAGASRRPTAPAPARAAGSDATPPSAEMREAGTPKRSAAPAAPPQPAKAASSPQPVTVNAPPAPVAARAAEASPPPPTLRVVAVPRTSPGAAGGPRGVAASAAPTARVSSPGGAREGGRAIEALSAARGPSKAKTFSTVQARARQRAESAAKDDNIERMVRVVRIRLGHDRGHTVMRLDPPELGSLRLEMDLRGAALTLRVETSTQVAHDLLSRDVEALRRGLQAAGIHLERIEIRPPAPPAEPREQAPSQGSGGGFGGDAPAHDGSTNPDAEHSGDWGRESHPAGSTAGAIRSGEAEPAAEPAVNVIA